MIKVLDAGLLTTVQDLGRYGYQRYGVSPSGVMDEFSAKVANKLVENNENESILETTMKGVSLEFLSDSVVAITGGQCDITINGDKIELWRSYKVKTGDILKMGFCKSGLRNYLAFSGGIDVPVIMNSKSTNLKAKLGGYKGRKLQVNDILNIGKQDSKNILEFNKDNVPSYKSELEIRVILGQQEDHFTDDGIKVFFNEIYSVTQESDRMGMRLQSASEKIITHKEGADIISDGITFGAIQVPGNGQPIIMMADRQTTGGYTKIGNIISTDLPKLAQAKPGTKIKFIRCGLDEGIEFLKKMNKIINDKESYTVLESLNKNEEKIKELEIESNKYKHYTVKLNGKIFKVDVQRIG